MFNVSVITTPETRIRRKFVDPPAPYSRIISVDGLEVTDRIPYEAPREKQDLLFKDELAADLFTGHFKEFHSQSTRKRRGTNCARFALAMLGTEVAHYRDAFAPLSEAIRPEHEWHDESVPLPLGAIGVIGTLEPSPDRPFGPHFLHAFVSMGADGMTLQDMAVHGFSGIRPMADTISYIRNEGIGEHRPDRTLYEPEDIRLFLYPQ